ncbi:MAG TPA: hypothetical protein VKW04_06030 [Planctomycetota bacterium]|nr:hypothetical protein [Planctomycetota bacterium]
MTRLVLLAAPLVLMTGCSTPPEMEALLPPPARAIIDSPDSVRACRLNLGPYPQGTKRPESWPEVPTVAEVPIEGALRDEVCRLLLDPASYAWEGKGCRPHPGVKFQFKKGSSTVEVYLCLECFMLTYRAEIPENPYWGNFDPIAPAVLRIVKGLFPNDAEIQALFRRG